jgi:hypothetical protein
MSVYFIGSMLILAVLLFFPASKLVWVLSIRRLQLEPELAKGPHWMTRFLRNQANRPRPSPIVLVIFAVKWKNRNQNVCCEYRKLTTANAHLSFNGLKPCLPVRYRKR